MLPLSRDWGPHRRVLALITVGPVSLLFVAATLSTTAAAGHGRLRRCLEIVGHNDFEGETLNAELVLDGDYAYVGALTEVGLRIADIEDPSNPTRVGYFPTPGVFPINVKAQGSVAVPSIQPTDFTPNASAFTGVI